MRHVCLSLGVAALALAAGSQAAVAGTISLGSAVLSASMTVDNSFEASISTSPTAAGTVFLSGSNWPSTFTGSQLVSGPGTYYLHVRAQDSGRPEMFIGRFTLTGLGATFANGTQELVTNITDWVVSTSAFGVDTTAPIFLGDNGASPWGNFVAMGSSADFIWSPQYVNGVAFFTASFTIVPSPAAATLLGLSGLVAARRRRA